MKKLDSMIQVINDYASTCLENKKIHPQVIRAIRQVPRHHFVKENAYADCALPIGHGQTISQPFVVAYMTELLDLKPLHRVLEIGMGSGYQSAVLSKLAREVYTVEIIKELAIETYKKLKKYSNIQCKIGNGYYGWRKFAPYDRIIVAAATNMVPQNLINQLKNKGKMIIPINKNNGTKLVLLTKTLCLLSGKNNFHSELIEEKELMDVRFVPLVQNPN
jgi:protein-L-isoaspartate(D-aspartate) O-methyltransferase